MKHTHKYRRINIGRKPKEYWVMSCSLPNCPHYTAMQTKLSAPNLVGKLSICNKCNEEFELTRRAIKMSFPTCDNCVEGKDKIIVKKATDFFDELEKGLK